MKKKRLTFDIKRAIKASGRKYNKYYSFRDISSAADISIDTIKAISSRKSYNVTLKTVEKLSKFLLINPTKYFKWEEK